MQQATAQQQQTGQPARVFTEFDYQTLRSWSRARRVVAKAEQLEGKENPRYVVTSLGWLKGYLECRAYSRESASGSMTRGRPG